VQREFAFKRVAFPLLEAGSTEQVLFATKPAPGDPYGEAPDFIISNACNGCGGLSAGDPYPFLHTNADGHLKRIEGWDSRTPTFRVLEDPEACNIVSREETIAIGEWDIFATSRYSDACDYIMTCLYEENNLLAGSKPYWFSNQVLTDDVLFWITFKPMAVDQVSQGFCFPDLEAAFLSAAELEAMNTRCVGQDYFSQMKTSFLAEAFMFVQADTDDPGNHHRTQDMTSAGVVPDGAVFDA
jgi:hypothetical protein